VSVWPGGRRRNSRCSPPPQGSRGFFGFFCFASLGASLVDDERDDPGSERVAAEDVVEGREMRA